MRRFSYFILVVSVVLFILALATFPVLAPRLTGARGMADGSSPQAPWSVFQDGLLAAAARWKVVGVALLALGTAMAFVVSLLDRLCARRLDLASLLSLGVGGGIILLMLLACPLVIVSVLFKNAADYPAVFGICLLGLWLGIAALNVPFKKLPRGDSRVILAFSGILLSFIVLRMAFIHRLDLPMYSDSVEHYLIANDFLHPEAAPEAFYTLPSLFSRYYHFGFHLLVVWVSALANSSASEAILVLGQILQALAPAALFFPLKAATKSDGAALFGVLLAGLGWVMPSFASNWGKYPALAGILSFPFALGMLYLSFSARTRRRRWICLCIAGAGGLFSLLAHSRNAIVLVIGLAALLVAHGLQRLRGWRLFAIPLLITMVTVAVGLLGIQKGLGMALSPYLREGVIPAVLVVLMIPFAMRHWPRVSAMTLVFIMLILCCLLIRMPAALQAYGYLTLLDGPFVQMVLFLPLSILGGLGFAGLCRSLSASRRRVPHAIRFALYFLLCGVITLNAFYVYHFSPSPCCRLVTEDDSDAYAWIEDNIAQDALILISGSLTPYQFLGVDGGLWITALTGRQTLKWSYDAALDSQDTLASICSAGATHLYAGRVALSFRFEDLAVRPDWYQPVFALPKAHLYRIICADVSR